MPNVVLSPAQGAGSGTESAPESGTVRDEPYPSERAGGGGSEEEGEPRVRT